MMSFLVSVLLQTAQETSLSGYKALIRTTIYEDGSIARKVELNLNPDNKEAIQFKKKFLTDNGYVVYEKATDSSFYLVGSKDVGDFVKNENVFSDGLSSIRIRKIEEEFEYREEFFTAIVVEEVQNSDLRNDEAAAKVLLADTQFDFQTKLPGRMLSVNTGEFDQNEARWKYDIEQLFKNPSFIMEAKSSVARDEVLIGVVLMIGLLIMTMGLLWLIKIKIG
jgi:hypothetical protein